MSKKARDCPILFPCFIILNEKARFSLKKDVGCTYHFVSEIVDEDNFANSGRVVETLSPQMWVAYSY